MIKKYLSLFSVTIGIVAQSCSIQKHGTSFDVVSTRNSAQVANIQEPPALHEYANPINDWCFKHIFGEVLSESGNANDLTRDLLNSLLELSGEEEIVELHFCDSNVNPDQKEDHAFITDVHCIDKKGCKFIIEMQVATHKGWNERMQAYVARDYGKQLPRGGRYNNILPVHLLAITNFNMFPARVDFLSHHRITEGKTKECFFKGMQWTVLELTKFNKTTSEVIEGKDRWAFLLKNAESISNMPDDEQRLILSNTIIRDAYARIDKANWTSEERELYERTEEKRRLTVEVLKTAFEEGEEKGRNEERKKFEEERKRMEEEHREKKMKRIINMLQKGHDEESIKDLIYSDEEDTYWDNMINSAKELQSEKRQSDEREIKSKRPHHG